MTPGIAFVAGGTFAASAASIVAQAGDGVSGTTTGVNVGIFAIGAAVIGWLVKRERDDRLEDRNTRRRDDERTQARLEQLEAAYHGELDRNRSLYERMLRLAHKVHPETEVAELEA